ncbi:MAG: lipoprotein-releasing ABC transporter permease subunit [Methylotenera sp.]|nr:lipoprotein-releasing ABC transporter permease subunit [Methylotenera sp.]MDP1754833.1 lipoprotein-releasing ABC transporter permease subunit [Methylotenera sp.]MDP1959712.1 lipoprotein-releasing ABC transporter permease subunit [Methylotenera sp.]MDP3207195.1 lipoprotein-releasing ABC transporter permease subunit [Methylotenera sp.]MDP3304262.1 lipoprotein-releasing ABC transporter permease subunit [Methylotenera sp.]
MKSLPFELFVGWRYTRAKRKNHFISFISLTSMIGIALGVAALIVVLSVMNGFQKELRTRILGVASHLEITGSNNQLADWQRVAEFSAKQPHVLASAPYITAQGMLSYDQGVQGAIIRGVVPDAEDKVADLGKHMKAGSLNDLRAGEFGIVLGADLAYALGAQIGDKVVVMAPQGQFTPTGVVPRLKQFTLVGLFQIGMYEYDAGLALIHIDDAAKLYRMGQNVSGVRLKLNDLFDAPTIAAVMSAQLNNASNPDGNYFVTDWTRQHANFFRAVQMEKRVMFIILTLIVAVAAFNIVSTLVMAVTDKRADIAIMRTFGASPGSIMRIFMVQGALIGVIGTVLGAFFGILLALNIETIIPFIERLFQVQFLAKDVYYISDLPSDLVWSDVATIVMTSFFLSLLATIYPSYKASKINPAEALRYE